jgi:hypothetical protein
MTHGKKIETLKDLKRAASKNKLVICPKEVFLNGAYLASDIVECSSQIVDRLFKLGLFEVE